MDPLSRQTASLSEMEMERQYQHTFQEWVRTYQYHLDQMYQLSQPYMIHPVPYHEFCLLLFECSSQTISKFI